jgi:micrococcal nuclease
MMPGKAIFLPLLLLLVPILPGGWGQAGADAEFPALVTKIIDGDSLRVRTAGGKELEIRLYGLDSPEYDQPFAAEAKALAKRLALGRSVAVAPVETDRYGRTVALVKVSGRAVNRELVAAGFAWVSPRYCRREVCREWRALEEQARRDRVGLWRQAEPIPPWRWKRGAPRR